MNGVPASVAGDWDSGRGGEEVGIESPDGVCRVVSGVETEEMVMGRGWARRGVKRVVRRRRGGRCITVWDEIERVSVVGGCWFCLLSRGMQ